MDSITKGDIYIIEYFAHWCEHCKAFKGQYINFAKFIEKYHNHMDGYSIKLFAIDLEARDDDVRAIRTIKNRHDLNAYPTVLAFIDSAIDPIRFGDGGSKYDLYRWLKSMLQQRNIAITLKDFPEEYCLNSINGPHHITDSKGWICTINQVNQKTGCCDTMGEYDYTTVCDAHRQCDEYFPCCSDYESCIGCCLNTINSAFDGEILQHPFHTNDRKRLLNIENTYFRNFTHCRHQCRTSSSSTFEGNVYVDYRTYYCYSNNISSYEDPDRLLKHVAHDQQLDIVVGDKGESCMSVCRNDSGAKEDGDHKKRVCIEDMKLMSQINSCTAINKYFTNCKGGCVFGYDNFLPAFAASQSRCYLKATLAKQQKYSCSASNPDHKRLCLCQVL